MNIRSRNLFDPNSDAPYKFSRSQVELFVNCRRCFYLDRRLGVSRVSGPAFTLNSATDTLLKKEFDLYRQQQTPHPIAIRNGLNLVPYADPRLDDWRANSKGVQHPLAGTTLLISGAIDDLWVDPETQELHLVDYKSTSKTGEITLDDPWKAAYKRQMEVYQWLLRKKDLPIHNRCYFVYVNGLTTRPAFDNRLEFEMFLLAYDGNDTWVEPTIREAWNCLRSEKVPIASPGCSWCSYRDDAASVFR
jgi:hypothetical protein